MALFYVYAVVIGLFFGSFVNCVAYRSVRGESFLTGRSHCPACGHTLSAGELIPLFSWLIQRGRCRHCGAKISLRYPLAELGCAAGLALALAVCGLTWKTVAVQLLVCLLLGATISDLDRMEIADGWWLGGCIVFVGFTLVTEWGGGALWPAFGRGILGALTASVPVIALTIVMDRVLKKPSMGYADIKLFFMAGLWTGWKGAILLLLVSCLLGLGFGLLPAGKKSAAKAAAGEDDVPAGGIPFGPAICAAALITILWGERLLDAYLSLF